MSSLGNDPAYSDRSDAELHELLDESRLLDAEHDERLAARDRRTEHAQELQARSDLYRVRHIDVSPAVPVLGHMARGRRDVEAGTPVNPKPWENTMPATVPCVMCGNPASRLAGLVHKPGTQEREACCSKACAQAFIAQESAPLPRFRVRYWPNPMHMGQWAIIDTAQGEDHVVGRAIAEDDALRRADARNKDREEPAPAEPAKDLAPVATLRKFVSPLTVIDGGKGEAA